MLKDVRRHRGGRAFAVRPGNRNADLFRHQPAQHFTVGILRNSQFAGEGAFRVFRIHRRAIDDKIDRLREEVSVVALVDAQPAFLKLTLAGDRRLQVGTGHDVSQTGE